MTTFLAPYVQIGKVVKRSLGLSKSRWLYVLVASFLTIVAVGGGITWKWGLGTLWSVVTTSTEVYLQICWPFVVTALMRLNTPIAAQTVPHYVARLRHTALGIWLAISIVIGLLDGHSLMQVCFVTFGAGALMLLISTPWRWPVQWCVFMALLVYAGGRSHDIAESAFVKTLLGSPLLGWMFAIACHLAMAWLVTRLISTNGSRLPAILFRNVWIENAAPGAEAPAKLPIHAMGPVVVLLQQFLLRFQFPWRLYLRHALAPANPSVGRAPQPVVVLARAMLGLGPTTHWVMQVTAYLMLWVVVALIVIVIPVALGGDVQTLSGGWSIVIAIACLMIAVVPLLSLPEILLETTTEQKLMLLLPGMPHGNELNRLLAGRHLCHAFVAWSVAAVSVAALPYPEKDVLWVGVAYLNALVLLPMVISDWVRIQAPTAISALWALVRSLIGFTIGLAAVHLLGVALSAVAVAAVVCCVTLLVLRWTKLAQFAPAFPAGRLLRQETARSLNRAGV
jgi:hypothetical protein